MKTGLVCNIPVTEGEVTIVQAENAAAIMKHSCELALASQNAGAGVLIVNTGLSKRRFKEAATETGIELSVTRDTNYMVSPERTPLIIKTSLAGELANELGGIRQACEEAKIKIVVITGWEFTSSNYQRKEKLFYGLRQLLSDLDIAVVVYTFSPSIVKAGQYCRGGVGKLAVIAYEVLTLGSDEELGESETDLEVFTGVKTPRPVLGGGEQLSVKKINELQTVFAEDAPQKQRTFARAA